MKAKTLIKPIIYPPPRRKVGRPRKLATVARLAATKRKAVARYRINMLDPENFTVALLGEFGYYRRVIAAALGITMGQVNRRLKFAQVDPAAYRRGESPIAQMIIGGVAKAGVPQLRNFADGVLRDQLHQLGWTNNGIKPSLEDTTVVPTAAPASVPLPTLGTLSLPTTGGPQP